MGMIDTLDGGTNCARGFTYTPPPRHKENADIVGMYRPPPGPESRCFVHRVGTYYTIFTGGPGRGWAVVVSEVSKVPKEHFLEIYGICGKIRHFVEPHVDVSLATPNRHFLCKNKHDRVFCAETRAKTVSTSRSTSAVLLPKFRNFLESAFWGTSDTSDTLR